MTAPGTSTSRPARLRWLAVGGLFGALMALAVLTPVAAQEATATASPVGAGVSGFGIADWLNLLLRLALVLVVIWLAILGMRWWVRRTNGGVGGRGGHLQIVETRALGPNRSLQLVRLGNRAVLLGVTADRISSVLEIDDPIEVERLSRPAVVQDSPTSFRDAVSRLGSLSKWRPVIERTPSAPRSAPQATRVARPSVAPAAGAVTPPARRATWVTLARRVIGLEDPPRPATAGRAAVAIAPRAAPPAAAVVGRAAAGGRAPLSMASASTAAAELPASRAVRARSGYRQNQIAEAQRAISAVRGQLPQ